MGQKCIIITSHCCWTQTKFEFALLVTDRTPYKHYMDLPISLWRRKEMMIAIIFEYGSFLHSVCCILLYRVIYTRVWFGQFLGKNWWNWRKNESHWICWDWFRWICLTQANLGFMFSCIVNDKLVWVSYWFVIFIFVFIL